MSAGPITLSGVSPAVTITTKSNGDYGIYSDTTRLLWTGGESLTFSAPGMDLRDFCRP